MTPTTSGGGAGERPGGWQALAAIVSDALDRPERERAQFLDRACGGDPALRREVESLLAADGADGGPVERLAAALQQRRVGPYAVVREIGRGGMGVVYLARRADGQYERDVALKVAQHAIQDGPLRDRFLAERHILAGLSHPKIAAFYDGGVTADGHPYFTMELVHGEPIDAYCDRRRLDVQARLRLFLEVCDAVAAAHRCLVVHRDLKPTNVLVTGDGLVKLLDFGIAKLLDPGRPSGGDTHPAARFFTRDYASPEQVIGGAMTTASDVYSLGALLYLLLTGRMAHRFDGDAPADVERVVCRRDAVRPSDAAVAADDVRAAAAEARRSSPKRLQRQLRGDLDNIVLRALSKEPTRRYPSVEALALDLQRHLAHLPVDARPDGLPYRAGKFIRRHRTPVVVSAAVAASLVAGIAGTVVQMRRAQIERERADTERDRAHAAAARAVRISGLVTDLFKLAEPGALGGGSVTARELLDQGAARIEAELASEPETQAAMYAVLGRVYANLASLPEAEAALERAIELRQRLTPDGSLETAAVLEQLAVLRYERSEYASAEELSRRSLALRQRLGAPTADRAASLSTLGLVLSETSRYDEAEARLREALELYARSGAAPDAGSVQARQELALVLLRTGQAAAAAPLFRQAVAEARALPDRPGRVHVSGLLNLARLVHRFERKPEHAEPLYREALAVARSVFPAHHPHIANCLGELAQLLAERGRAEEAEAAARDALAIWMRVYGPRHRETMITTQRLAGILAQRGRPREAEPLFRQALATGHALFGDGHPMTLTAQSALAEHLEERRRWREALAVREAALSAARRRFGEQDVYVARALTGLGELHSAMQQHARAEPPLRRALEIRRRIHPEGHWRIAEAQVALATALAAAGRYAEAEELLTGAQALLAGAADAAPRDLGVRARDSIARIQDVRRRAGHARRER